VLRAKASAARQGDRGTGELPRSSLRGFTSKNGMAPRGAMPF